MKIQNIYEKVGRKNKGIYKKIVGHLMKHKIIICTIYVNNYNSNIN